MGHFQTSALRNGEVRLTSVNGHRQPDPACPKSARKNDRWPSYRFYRALQRLKSPMRERDHHHGRRVSKFWRDYAGAIPVEAIDNKVMRDFIPWRRDYYSNFKICMFRIST